MDAKKIEYLHKLYPTISSKIFGQDDVLKKLTTLVANALLFPKQDEPLGLYFFLGATGTGKTETALQLAGYLFSNDTHSHKMFHKFLMPEYGEEDAITKFIGDARTRQNGLFGDVVMSMPSGGVLLFDEIEKANHRIHKVLLGFESASITLASGQVLDLSKFLMIFTSNVGTAVASQAKHKSKSATSEYLMTEMKKVFSPEIVNRFEFFVFNKLGQDAQKSICDYLLGAEMRHCSETMGMSVEPHADHKESLRNYLLENGVNELMGARPLKRFIKNSIQTAIQDMMGGGSGVFVRPPHNCQRILLEVERRNGKRSVVAHYEGGTRPKTETQKTKTPQQSRDEDEKRNAKTATQRIKMLSLPTR